MWGDQRNPSWLSLACAHTCSSQRVQSAAQSRSPSYGARSAGHHGRSRASSARAAAAVSLGTCTASPGSRPIPNELAPHSAWGTEAGLVGIRLPLGSLLGRGKRRRFCREAIPLRLWQCCDLSHTAAMRRPPRSQPKMKTIRARTPTTKAPNATRRYSRNARGQAQSFFWIRSSCDRSSRQILH